MMNKLPVHKWVPLIISIYNTPEEYRYSQKLQHKINTTSSHIRKLLKHLESAGLILRKRTRKIQYIKLTQKGKQIAELLMKIKQEVKSNAINKQR